jgi:hypothetical protein
MIGFLIWALENRDFIVFPWMIPIIMMMLAWLVIEVGSRFYGRYLRRK